LSDLMEIEDWLFEVDLNTPIEDIKTKHDVMEKKIVTIQRKVAELKTRPVAVKSLRKVLEAVKAHVASWSEKRPQIEQDETEEVLSRVQELKEWIDGKEAEQSELSDVDEPAFTSSEISGKVKSVTRILKRLLKRPKLKSVYLEAPDPEGDKKKSKKKKKKKEDDIVEEKEKSDKEEEEKKKEDEVEEKSEKEEL